MLLLLFVIFFFLPVNGVTVFLQNLQSYTFGSQMSSLTLTSPELVRMEFLILFLFSPPSDLVEVQWDRGEVPHTRSRVTLNHHSQLLVESLLFS